MEWDMAMDWKEVPGDWVPASAHPGMGARGGRAGPVGTGRAREAGALGAAE